MAYGKIRDVTFMQIELRIFLQANKKNKGIF